MHVAPATDRLPHEPLRVRARTLPFAMMVVLKAAAAGLLVTAAAPHMAAVPARPLALGMATDAGPAAAARPHAAADRHRAPARSRHRAAVPGLARAPRRDPRGLAAPRRPGLAPRRAPLQTGAGRDRPRAARDRAQRGAQRQHADQPLPRRGPPPGRARRDPDRRPLPVGLGTPWAHARPMGLPRAGPWAPASRHARGVRPAPRGRPTAHRHIQNPLFDARAGLDGAASGAPARACS